jgi:hypothetical protein
MVRPARLERATPRFEIWCSFSQCDTRILAFQATGLHNQGANNLVASPRNQRYLHPRSLGAGVFVCEID